MLRRLLEETNIMTTTIKNIFGTPVEKSDIRAVTFKFHGQGSYRVAYLVNMSIRGLGMRETVFKITHSASTTDVFHQVLGRLVDPPAKTAGIWEMENKKAVLTEDYVIGDTFDHFINRPLKEEFKIQIATLLTKRCFLFWKNFHHIFIKDPHRYQFIVVEQNGEHIIKVIDTGSVATAENVTYEITNNGDVIIKTPKGEVIKDLRWIYKVPPRELLGNLIFFLEKPDETPGGDYTSLDGYEKAYNLPRIALYDGIMYAFGQKDGAGFLREVKGIDPELDKLAEQKGAY